MYPLTLGDHRWKRGPILTVGLAFFSVQWDSLDSRDQTGISFTPGPGVILLLVLVGFLLFLLRFDSQNVLKARREGNLDPAPSPIAINWQNPIVHLL